MSAFTFSQRPGLAGLSAGGRELCCNPAGLANVYTFFNATEKKLEEIPDDSPRVNYTRREAENGVKWTAVIDGRARVQIAAKVYGEQAAFVLCALTEPDDMKLVSFRLEGLCAAVETDARSRLALPAHGGRVIDPKTTADGQTDHRYNWILDSLGSCAFAYTDGLVCVLKAYSMDDMLTSRVGGEKGERSAQLGALLRHRYTFLDPSYRRAKPSSEPRPEQDINYPVETDFEVLSGSIEISLLPCESLLPKSGWVPGARYVRSQLPDKPSDYYKDKLVYKLFAGSPTDGVRTTYKQMGEIIRQVRARTGVEQVAYIVGFQHRGHDDGYPDVFTVNEGAGTEEELKALVSESEKLGARVSFHDNYDDAYRESPAFDADIIARDASGGLLRGGVWNGHQAYWTSLPHYAGALAQKRIDQILARYPFLKDTYHLDVLTASVFRLDFRAGDPAGRQRDLEARLRLIEQFRECGLDVSSEACGLPFIGTISYFWHMQRVPRALYEGDSRAPIAPFLVHGKADHGGAHTDHPSEILDGLLYGCFYCNDVTADTPIKNLTDAAIMLLMPLNELRNLAAVSYEEENGWKKVTYESGDSVAVNFESLECRVTIGGRRYIENGTAMIPQSDGSTLLYVSWEEPYMPVSMPVSLQDGASVKAVPMGAEAEERELTVRDGKIMIDLTPGIAYKVTL